MKKPLREKCPDTDQKKLRIRTLIMQWVIGQILRKTEWIIYDRKGRLAKKAPPTVKASQL